MFYLSQLYINSMFAFLLQELQYIYYIIYMQFQHQKQLLINARMK